MRTVDDLRRQRPSLGLGDVRAPERFITDTLRVLDAGKDEYGGSTDWGDEGTRMTEALIIIDTLVAELATLKALFGPKP